MADKTISELTEATAIQDADLFVLEQSSTAKKLQGTTLKNYVNTAVEAAKTAAVTAITNEGTRVLGTIPADYTALNRDFAAVYSSSSTYAVGDFCTYGGVLYKCNTAITTAEAWTAAHWTQTNVDTELDLHSSQIEELQDDLYITETEGKFIIDSNLEWVNGTMNQLVEVASTTRIRTPYIAIPDYSRILYLSLSGTYQVSVFEYNIVDDSYVFIRENSYRTTDLTLQDTTKAVRLVVRKSDNSNISPSEHVNLTAKFSTYNKAKLSQTITSSEENYPSNTAVMNYVDGKIAETNDVFIGSKTENKLDISNYYTSFRITNASPYFVTNSNNTRISYPVFVKGQKKVHLHCDATSANTRWCAFTTDKTRDASSVVTPVVQGLQTTLNDITLTVPNGAVWLYVTLGFSNEDFSSYTISYGENKTNDSYEASGIVAIENDGIEHDSEYDHVCRQESNTVIKKFLPYTVGSPNASSQTVGQQYSRTNLLFFTDSHTDYVNPTESLDNVNRTIKFANAFPVALDAVINAGDIITPFDEIAKSTAIANAEKFFKYAKKSKYPFIFAKGNHDLNDWRNLPSNVLTDSDWSSLFLDYAESTYGIVRQTKSSGYKSTWHYYDIVSKKIRIISVDVQDTDKTSTDSSGHVKYYGGNSWYISSEQLNWIADVALDFDDKSDLGWGVIFVLHQDKHYSTGLTPAYESAIAKLHSLCVAFNNHSTYSVNYTFSDNTFYNISLTADYTRYANLDSSPHVICWLIGHEHADKYSVEDGINMIWTANGSAADGDDRVERVLNTSLQNCFDLISIDTVQRKIRIVRYGAGVTCTGTGGDRFLPDGLSY